MQANPRQLLRQQIILTGLGFYSGPLDGVWGPQSIEAMKRFERRLELFRPARPTNGMPFSATSPLPKGVYRDKGRDMLLMHACVADFADKEAAALATINDSEPRIKGPGVHSASLAEKEDGGEKKVRDTPLANGQPVAPVDPAIKQDPRASKITDTRGKNGGIPKDGAVETLGPSA